MDYGAVFIGTAWRRRDGDEIQRVSNGGFGTRNNQLSVFLLRDRRGQERPDKGKKERRFWSLELDVVFNDT